VAAALVMTPVRVHADRRNVAKAWNVRGEKNLVLFSFRNITAENLQLGVMYAGYGRRITMLATRRLPRLMKLWEKRRVKPTAARHRSVRKRTGMRRTRT